MLGNSAKCVERGDVDKSGGGEEAGGDEDEDDKDVPSRASRSIGIPGNAVKGAPVPSSSMLMRRMSRLIPLIQKGGQGCFFP